MVRAGPRTQRRPPDEPRRRRSTRNKRIPTANRDPPKVTQGTTCWSIDANCRPSAVAVVRRRSAAAVVRPWDVLAVVRRRSAVAVVRRRDPGAAVRPPGTEAPEAPEGDAPLGTALATNVTRAPPPTRTAPPGTSAVCPVTHAGTRRPGRRLTTAPAGATTMPAVTRATPSASTPAPNGRKGPEADSLTANTLTCSGTATAMDDPGRTTRGCWRSRRYDVPVDPRGVAGPTGGVPAAAAGPRGTSGRGYDATSHGRPPGNARSKASVTASAAGVGPEASSSSPTALPWRAAVASARSSSPARTPASHRR